MSVTPSPNDLEQLLQLSTRGDLAMFSLEYAKGNKDFKKALRAYLSKKYLHNTETASDYASQMANAFCETKDIGDGWHSYEVTDWDAIFNEANKIIEKGKKLLDLGNADAAATIAMEFIRQLCDNFDENEIDPYDDESIDGHYECEQAENLLLNAISHPDISKDLKKHIVEEVKSLSNRDVADYDLIDLNDLKLEVTRRALSNEEGLRLLDEQIQSQKGNYNLHVYVERKIALLRQMGKDADADKEEQKYIRLHEIRKIVVDRLVEQKQYDKAAEYAKAGIGLDNGREVRWADTMWTKRLLEIYELQDNKPGQIKAARALFVSSFGDAKYYHKLKALIPKDEWKQWLEQLIADTPFSNIAGFGDSNLADIYVEEKETEKLYEYIKANSKFNTDALDHYAPYTDSSHHEELLSMYVELLKKDASGKADVNKYPPIAASMECMQKLKGGKVAAHQLAVFFREQYRRRSSMMAAIKKF